jgi:hypothetical protein
MLYTPPTTQDLADLKASLNRTGDQMADLFGLAGSHQWRKYTGGQSPREMSPQMAFFAAARLELDQSQIDRIVRRMRDFGADIDLDGDTPAATKTASAT